MLYFMQYGCSISHERLIVEADNFEKAEEYAERAAQDVYYSYDYNYPSIEDYNGYTEDEISDMSYQDMLNDIDWSVESYNEKNEDHIETLKEQGGIPFEI